MVDITITEGGTLEVDYSVENTGDGTGDQDIRLEVQQALEDTDANIVLDPAQTATGTLSWPTESGDAVTDAIAEVVTDDTSDSITVTVEDAIPDSVVYDFESDKELWSGTEYTRSTTQSYDGSFSLDIAAAVGDDEDRHISGVMEYGFVPGDKLTVRSFADSASTNVAISASPIDESSFIPGSAENFSLNYQTEYDDARVVYQDGSGSVSEIDKDDPYSGPVRRNEWVDMIIDYVDSSTMDFSLVDSSGGEFYFHSIDPNAYSSTSDWSHLSLGLSAYANTVNFIDEIVVELNGSR